VAADFDESAFVGIRGAAHPDDWRVGYPTLASYRDDWLAQSAAFGGLSFVGETGAALLHRATRLGDIEILQDRAIAHKKFKAVAALDGGGDYSLDWQTLYYLRRASGRWLITGFTGYLPHPFPTPSRNSGISQPPGASQHVTAGPYSPVLRVNPGVLVAISGQGPIDASGAIIGADIVEQTRLTLDNCVKQLTSGGAALADVFQVRVYLSSMADWPKFNAVYQDYFDPPYPVRTAIEARLWGGILVEIDMTANVVS
jgi:2-iminobutanoate/2-iminopropanoate deaminase